VTISAQRVTLPIPVCRIVGIFHQAVIYLICGAMYVMPLAPRDDTLTGASGLFFKNYAAPENPYTMFRKGAKIAKKTIAWRLKLYV